MDKSEEKKLREELRAAKEELEIQEIYRKAGIELAKIDQEHQKWMEEHSKSMEELEAMSARHEAEWLAVQPKVPKNLGYKKAKTFGIAYTLDCGHFIRARGTNKNGRTVFCEICMAERRVAGVPRMN